MILLQLLRYNLCVIISIVASELLKDLSSYFFQELFHSHRYMRHRKTIEGSELNLSYSYCFLCGCCTSSSFYNSCRIFLQVFVEPE